MITVENVTKRYGDKVAVDSLSFTVHPGVITGFLGPNGAGKSTTMRMIMGLDSPTTGRATVNGKSLAEHRAPMHEVGALLEDRAIHPGRSAYDHLSAMAATNGIPDRRVREVLDTVGLTSVARKRAGAFSLGMRQRLGIAGALLGDPDTVIRDEPVNGLDPEGIVWIRNLLKDLAAQGRTVFVSSHLISEMGLMAEHLIVVGRGKLIADMTVEQLRQSAVDNSVDVDTPDPSHLTRVLLGDGVSIDTTDEPNVIRVTGLPEAIGDRAFEARIPLHALVPRQPSLEEAFMTLTHDSVEYQPVAA
ncbi:MAG TPA: ATP-binding cassette domain-containing protein [Thermomicrobiales bacterium]|nr:ATP-binding cassette domain-containing protein [Thermomicrobiales bacterium]